MSDACKWCGDYHDKNDLPERRVENQERFIVHQDVTTNCSGWGDGCWLPTEETFLGEEWVGRGVNKRLEWIYNGTLYAREDGKCAGCVAEWNECGIFALHGSFDSDEARAMVMPLFAPSVMLGEAPPMLIGENDA